MYSHLSPLGSELRAEVASRSLLSSHHLPQSSARNRQSAVNGQQTTMSALPRFRSATYPGLPWSSSSSAATASSSSSSSTTPRASMEKAPLLLLSLPISHARRHTKLLLSLVTSLTLLVLIVEQRAHPGNSSLLSPFFSFATEDPPAPLITSEPQPLTELGFEADLTYENIGSTDKDAYRIELEQFLHRSFPPSDADESNPNSLLSILHEFLPPPPPSSPLLHPQRAYQRLVLLPFQLVVQKVGRLIEQASRKPPPVPAPRPPRHIPQKIFQTSWQAGTEPPSDKSPPKSWKDLNQDHEYRYFDNAAAQAFMTERFGVNATSTAARQQGSKAKQLGSQDVKEGYTVADTYGKMSSVPVMQSDFWRYSVLAAEGGVYSESLPTLLFI